MHRVRGKRVLRPWLGAAAASLLAAAAQAGTFVYVHDSSNTQIYAFALGKDGALTPVADSPFAVPGASAGLDGYSQTMDYSRKRKVLYAGTGEGVSGMLVNEDGSLAPVAGSPFGPGYLHGVAVVELGGRVFVYAAELADDLLGFEAGAGGVLTALPSSPFGPLDDPSGIADRKNKLFVANETETVETLVIGKDGTPVAAPGQPVPIAADFTYNVNPDPKGKFAYVVDDGLEVFGFAVDKKTAALTSLASSPFPAAAGGATSGASVAKGLLLAFAFDEAVDSVQAFRIEKDGLLTALGVAQSTGVLTQSHALDAKGKWLIVAGSDAVASFAVDRKTGVLTPVDEEPIPGAAATPTATLILKR